MEDHIRGAIIEHISENARKKGIYVDQLNGYKEHLHLLISLGNRQTIAEIMQTVKGESSFWINRNRLTKLRFEWQDDYYAVSVSNSHVDRVREYIKNQENHHNKKTFNEEVDEFVARYGFVKLYDIDD